MAEYTRPINQAEYEANFEQIKPSMTVTMAQQESSRCLFCYDAPCQAACPTGIDIPLFIRQIQTGNLVGSARTIYDSNYLANTCGKVCPTEVLCEGSCVHTISGNKAIEIGRLQSVASSHVIKYDINLYNITKKSNTSKIAVIGAGPAGISAACELSKAGLDVTVFEAKAQPSGLSLHGVAPYKITNKEALDEVAYLQKQFGFQIKYNTKIETKEQLKQLEADFSRIFLGIGLGATNMVLAEAKGMEGCIGATEFIEKLKLNPFQTFVGQKVVVIGGGNTAMDAASESARMGAKEVTLVYRKAKEEMPAYEFEYDLAKGVGVKGIFGYSPNTIVGDQTVRAIRFTNTQNPSDVLEINCDMLIFATGQTKQTGFLSLIDGLQVDKQGRIVLNENYQTSNPRYFAGGDAANGGAEVVNAVAEAKKAAKAIIALI